MNERTNRQAGKESEEISSWQTCNIVRNQIEGEGGAAGQVLQGVGQQVVVQRDLCPIGAKPFVVQ